jgi:hypothetical protein
MMPVAASCRATASTGTPAAIAIGVWIRKIDCQETSSVSRPPAAGPDGDRAALGADGGGQQLEHRGNRDGAAQSLHAAGGDQGAELGGEAAGEAGAGEHGKADRRGPAWPDPPCQLGGGHRSHRHHQVEGDEHPGDAGDAGVELAVDLGQRQDDDRGVGEDEADGDREGGETGARGRAQYPSSVAYFSR